MRSVVVGILFVGSFFFLLRKMGHARFTNLLRRVAGLWFVSLGTLAILVEIVGTIWPAAFDEKTPTSGVIVLVGVFAVAIAIGVWLLRAPSYRPDLGDTMRLLSTEPWPEELQRRKNRTWWTGDPKITGNESLAPDARTI
jgi:hypothetical protein